MNEGTGGRTAAAGAAPGAVGLARAGAAMNAAPVPAVKVESGADLDRWQQPREGGEVPLGNSHEC